MRLTHALAALLLIAPMTASTASAETPLATLRLVVVDQTNAVLQHATVSIYTLDGKGITQDAAPPLRNCLQCGTTLPAALMQCECGYKFARRDPRIPRIFDLELAEVFAGDKTPETAKHKEYQRLRAIQLEKGYSLSWTRNEFRKLFASLPMVNDATREEQQIELNKLKSIARARGYNAGWVAHRFKATFGSWPQGARA